MFVATAPPVDIEWKAVSPLLVTAPMLKARTNPLLALTTGTLNPGAEDHGLVPAVAVTVCTEDSVTVPDVMVTGPVAVTVGVPEI